MVVGTQQWGPSFHFFKLKKKKKKADNTTCQEVNQVVPIRTTQQKTRVGIRKNLDGDHPRATLKTDHKQKIN